MVLEFCKHSVLSAEQLDVNGPQTPSTATRGGLTVGLTSLNNTRLRLSNVTYVTACVIRKVA